MLCKYCQVGMYEEYCTCGKNGQTCPFVRRCSNEHRWKPLDNMSKCKLGKDDVVIPDGMNKVRFELKGELYVEIGDFVYSIKNPYGHKPDFVEVTNVNGEWYVKGFEPKVASKKKKEAKK